MLFKGDCLCQLVNKVMIKSCYLKGDCLEEGQKCTQPCQRKRETCEHICALLCHGEEPCPPSLCKAQVSSVFVSTAEVRVVLWGKRGKMMVYSILSSAERVDSLVKKKRKCLLFT